MKPDPRQHLDLVTSLAWDIARQTFTDYTEWLGQCYEWVAEAADRYRGDSGASFRTYAYARIRYKFRDVVLSVVRGYDKTCAGGKQRKVRFTGQTEDQWAAVHSSEPSPVASAIMWEQQERWDEPKADAELAHMLGRGMAHSQMAAVVGVTSSRISQRMRLLRDAYGVPVDARRGRTRSADWDKFCLRGHEMTPDNRKYRADGTWRCKACERERKRLRHRPNGRRRGPRVNA